MAKWINRTVVQAPRNGTTSHTIAFTAATAGSLLVLVMEGAVTHTVPTGWTRRNQALNNTELSVYTKTATSGESSFTTTHNGSNYPVGAVIYEFAAGSTWVNGVSATGLASPGGANPTLSGLSGTNLLMAASATGKGAGNLNATSGVWNQGVEDVDQSVPYSTTDGYWLGIVYVEDSTATSFAPSVTLTNPDLQREGLTFAVKPAAGATPKQGAAAGAWTSAGAATGTSTRSGSASASWATAGAAAGSSTRSAVAAGAWTSAGTGTGRTIRRGTTAGTWATSVVATGRSARRGTATGAWAIAGQANGVRPVVGQRSGTAAGAWSSAGQATGATPVVGQRSGTATGAWSTTGQVTGKATRRGAGSGTWQTVSAASGQRPAVGEASGSAAGTWVTTGTAGGRRTAKASSYGQWATAGAAVGSRRLTGAANGAWLMAGAAAGAGPVPGRDITVTWGPLTTRSFAGTVSTSTLAGSVRSRTLTGTLED